MIYEIPQIDLIASVKPSESGVKEGTTGIYKTEVKENNFPLLILKSNIINSDGYGLKRGFYEVRPDKYYEFLVLSQSGEMKAKIPIINIEQIDKTPSKEKKLRFWEKNKYKKGKDPKKFIHKYAELKYDPENSCYILFYELQNTKIKGVLRIK